MAQGSAALHWCFTKNNPGRETDLIPLVARELCTYVVAGFEIGKQGTPHIQGFLSLARRRRLTALLKAFKGTLYEGAHWEIAKGTPKEASDYCKKEDKFEVHGLLPSSSGQATLDRWASALRVARSSVPQWDEVDPQILVSHYRSLQALSADACPTQTDQASCAGLWVAGPTGTGKTTTARALAHALAKDKERALFIKEPTRWWDAYRGEETVVLEDLHPNHFKTNPELAGELLLWGDRWTFSAQRKGLPPRRLRPPRFIVTSNYTPDRFFTGPTLAAWSRRAPLLLLLPPEAAASGPGPSGSVRLTGGEPSHWATAFPPSWWSELRTAGSWRSGSGTPSPPPSSPSPTAASTAASPAPSAPWPGSGSSPSGAWTSTTTPIEPSTFAWEMGGSSSSTPPIDEFEGYWR